MQLNDRIKGGLYGLLIGDALGVPYEFHPPSDIPPYAEIEMQPPFGFARTYPTIPIGTWSDDGAQALCLLDSLVNQHQFDLIYFADNLLKWYLNGLYAIDHHVFDVGVQTGLALNSYHQGVPAKNCGNVNPDGKGNGALMRVLPLALWHQGDDTQLVFEAHQQCLITHSNITNHVCCALYCLIARNLLKGCVLMDAFEQAQQSLQHIYQRYPDYLFELEWIHVIPPFCGKGSGYVVDSLRSVLMVLSETTSYEQAVKFAIKLGNDTDTTACITGGLAGILYGFDEIPARWFKTLRGKSIVEPLLNRLR